MSVEMERVLRKAVDSYNAGNLGVIDELCDRGFVYHGNGEEALTRDGLTRFIRGMIAAFPDMHIRVDDLFSQGDRLCYRITITGTHKGELMGLPPTGKKISLRSIGIMRFKDGKIVEEWENYDELGMLRQLGAIRD
ncbi:Aklanonic acid methyl ester cyclase DnrD [archaeon HR01]|nr:Aklanonic acid methyl ester cyclase DnrD [archaeon HR01]